MTYKLNGLNLSKWDSASIVKWNGIMVTPSPTPSVTPSLTPSVTPTKTVTPTVTPSLTPSVTPTRTVTPTVTPSLTPSVTPTMTVTPTVTPSLTPSVTPSRTVTPTVTPSLTPTVTPTMTVTPSVTPTRTVTPTVTPSLTPSVTPTMTVTPTVTPSITPSLTPSITPTRTVTPTPSPRPPITASVTNYLYNTYGVSCNGGSDGHIVVSSPSGGSGTGYQVKLNSGGTYVSLTSSIDYVGLIAGSYTVYVKDSTSTENTFPITLTQPTAQTATISSVTNPTCGNNNGIFTISSTGGLWTKTYVVYRDVTSPYEVGGGSLYTSFNAIGSGSPSVTLSSLPPGGYYFAAIDSNGCTTYSAVTTLPVPC